MSQEDSDMSDPQDRSWDDSAAQEQGNHPSSDGADFGIDD